MGEQVSTNEKNKWDGVERRNKKPKPIPTGPDLYLGGDGLPDWIEVYNYTWYVWCIMVGLIFIVSPYFRIRRHT